MVISKLNIDKIEKHLFLIQEFLIELRKLASQLEEDFLSDSRNPAAGESFLRRSLEAIFDVGRHILAKTYGFKELDYKKIALELGEKGILDKEYARTLVKMAGYRNRMVHLYNQIRPHEIFFILKNHLPDLERFVSEITAFIENYKKKNPQK